MFCANCGFQVADGSKFCPQCGAKIEAPAAPVAEPVAEAVAEPVVEKAGETVAERIEPVVEPAPAVEPVEVEPAKVEEAPVVEPAPAVEPVAVGPAPSVGPAPAVEPAPYVAGYASQNGAPAPGASVQPNVTPAPEAAPEKPKKKKKVWLIILIVLLALLLVGGCIIGVIVAVVITATKKAGNAINNIVNDPAYGIVSSEPGYTPGNGSGQELDFDVTTKDIVGITFAGDVQLVSVTGAESMIDYLQSVSGTPMSDSEKDAFRYPSITSMPYCELYVYDDQYSTGGWNFKVPYACGISSPELRQFSDWDMLTQEQIKANNAFDSVAIHPDGNTFLLKNQVPDEGNMYAGNLFSKYSDYMSNGEFGIQFGGKIRQDKFTGNSYGIDGTFVLMFWYDTMSEPYVITYNYQVDDVAASNSAAGYDADAGNGTGNNDYSDLFDDNGNIDFDNFDFDDFNFE